MIAHVRRSPIEIRMPKASKGGFYAVKAGRVPGVYGTWYVQRTTPSVHRPRNLFAGTSAKNRSINSRTPVTRSLRPTPRLMSLPYPVGLYPRTAPDHLPLQRRPPRDLHIARSHMTDRRQCLPLCLITLSRRPMSRAGRSSTRTAHARTIKAVVPTSEPAWACGMGLVMNGEQGVS
jgi:hypothetical protein